MKKTTFALATGVAIALGTGPAAATVYLDGVAAACLPTCILGTLQVGGTHASVAGAGPDGGSITNPAGTNLDGVRTYIWDQGGLTGGILASGVSNRGTPGFAMLIWDMGVAVNTMRLYTHQDHYSGGPITTPFVAQDVMEYSVWGSNDGDNFVLLSDVTAFDLTGGGAGKPTYTFVGTAPSFVYRGGSAEIGILNAYTRDYTFGADFRYFGVRTSSVSYFHVPIDADPEIDAVIGNAGPILPEPGTLALLGAALAGLAFRWRKGGAR